jgi:hypothetical protein
LNKPDRLGRNGHQRPSIPGEDREGVRSEDQFIVDMGSDMKDPLDRFVWSSLYCAYDAQSSRFNGTSPFLASLNVDSKRTDRSLYHELRNLFSKEQRTVLLDPIGVYEALLYWKLYTQPTASHNITQWLRQDTSKREHAQDKLLQLLQELPASLERIPSVIVDRVKWLGEFEILGMKNPGSLPVRTTFLHFMYPDVVPIFDQMVLKAVDCWM